MVEGCGGHPALDTRLPSCQLMVRYCVVEGSQFIIPPSMATVGMVLDGHRWCTV